MPEKTVILDEAGLTFLMSRIEALATEASVSGRRLVIGIGGVPGSGKSTLAEKLAERVEAAGVGAVVIGQDGFHLPNAVLRELGRYERKGAPDTYDVEGMIGLLRLYRDAAASGPYPVYDRANTHEPILAAQPIDPPVRVLLAEGQFMLLDEPPWDALGAVLDEGWWLDTPLETAKDWILDRHTATGRTESEALVKYENDRRNADRVLSRMREPALRLRWP